MAGQKGEKKFFPFCPLPDRSQEGVRSLLLTILSMAKTAMKAAAGGAAGSGSRSYDSLATADDGVGIGIGTSLDNNNGNNDNDHGNECDDVNGASSLNNLTQEDADFSLSQQQQRQDDREAESACRLLWYIASNLANTEVIYAMFSFTL